MSNYKYPYQENMTNDMLDCMIGDVDAIAEYELCLANLEKAKAAGTINLPATAASGEPVLHGARMVTLDIADYWQQRLQLAQRYVPREYFNRGDKS